jgi:predicted nucleic acid-binding protein
MPPNLTIEAEVFDIRNDHPRNDESFLVDTNVWLWLTYVNAGTGPIAARQVREYSAYLQKCLAKHCRLHFCGLTLAELSHQIEKTEREIYEEANGATLTTKEFRHNFPTERAYVTSEVQAAWAQVTALGDFLELTIDKDATNNAEARYAGNPIDGYDLFLHEAMKKANMSQILTDDGDFATVPSLLVFTSNPNVISTAQKQGKFKKR